MCEEEANGRLIIYRYPKRPLNIPLDNSDLIDKYIYFQELGIEGTIESLIREYPEFSEIVKERIQQKEAKVKKDYKHYI